MRTNIEKTLEPVVSILRTTAELRALERWQKEVIEKETKKLMHGFKVKDVGEVMKAVEKIARVLRRS